MKKKCGFGNTGIVKSKEITHQKWKNFVFGDTRLEYVPDNDLNFSNDDRFTLVEHGSCFNQFCFLRV